MQRRHPVLAISLALTMVTAVYAAETNALVSTEDTVRTVPPISLMTSDDLPFAWPSKESPKPLVLWFTNLCAGCQAVIPELDSLYRHELQPELEMAAVSLLGSDRATVKSVKEKLGIPFPILIDPEGKFISKITGGYVPES